MAKGSPDNTPGRREMLMISNRWVWSVYPGYTLMKQRIMLQALRSLQQYVQQVAGGIPVTQLLQNLQPGQDLQLRLDMSRVAHYNNYWQVRQAADEMCRQPLHVYTDNKFSQKFIPENYTPYTLFSWHEQDEGNRRFLILGLKREVAELLLHIHYGKLKHGAYGAYHFTKFDTFTVDTYATPRHQSKYLWPLYVKLCAYAQQGGITLPMADIRTLLHLVKQDPETREYTDKYKGCDAVRRKILDVVKRELDIFGQYSFNYKVNMKGRTADSVTFKVYKNTKYDPNHVWLKLQKAITVELPHFARLTDDQRDQFHYLLLPQYSDKLEKVLKKVQHIERAIQKRALERRPVRNVMNYILQALHEQYPPPE